MTPDTVIPPEDRGPLDDHGSSVDLRPLSDHGPPDEPDLDDALREFASIRLADVDLPALLSRVAELATATIPRVAAASVTIVPRDAPPLTASSTGPLALVLDEAQYDAGRGPCLDAARGQGVNLIVDMAADARWPRFAAAAAAAGVTSSLSVGIHMADTAVGSLNIYATSATAFDDESVGLAQSFAEYAAVALANVQLHETTTRLVDQLTEAMESRAVIEQAKGVLMAQQGLAADAAFVLMAQASQRANRKLRDLARGIVDGTAARLPAKVPEQD